MTKQVVTLAREYLGDGHTQLFGAQWGLKALSATSLGARLSGKAIRGQVEHMARTFIAGATAEEAVAQLTDLWQHGRAWSVDLLGEATISDREADRYGDRCLEAMTLLGREAASWPSRPLLEQDHLRARSREFSSPSKSLRSLRISIRLIRKEATVLWRRGSGLSSIWRCASPLR